MEDKILLEEMRNTKPMKYKELIYKRLFIKNMNLGIYDTIH